MVEGQDFHQAIIYGGKVEERERERLEKVFGTTHRVGDWEIKKLLLGKPEVVVIASGWEGALRVTEEERKKLGRVDLRVLRSEEAIREYNKLIKEGRKVNILVHTTC